MVRCRSRMFLCALLAGLSVAPSQGAAAPIWEWYKYLFPICWFGNDCFENKKQPGTPAPTPAPTGGGEVYPYYVVLRVYCVDAADPSRDRADSNLTVWSKISTEDAKANAFAQAQSRDLCKDGGDNTRMQSRTKGPEIVGSS